MEKNPTYDRVVQIIDEAKNDLVDLCLQLGNTTSPHAKERVLGEAVLGWLKECGIHGELQFITDESVNAVATVTGTSSGESLIFNAHMDTGPELGPDATEIERKLETAWIDRDMLFGKGMINDKAQLCAFMTRTPSHSSALSPMRTNISLARNRPRRRPRKPACGAI